ncbi:hypothetical protein N7493_012052 [Penicillium malachiteum]|uniref:Aminoglycoside phosphotransferase domain-containing protein n=1 Tax=Penicillium malachiteum TaxID=1324776 RepID=A0AAD6MQ22_9EURO|nr:hypothetical protein N7493_012052 [Penicillium malachiteum]
MATSDITLKVISSANLSPNEHLLLRNFRERALDPEFAAKYDLSRIQTGAGAEVSLRSFKQDWRNLISNLKNIDEVPEDLDRLVRRRDGSGCCMTDTTYIIPPSILRNDSASLEILEAFLSPSGLAQLKPLVGNHGDIQVALQNLWCLSPSVHQAIRNGDIVLWDQATRYLQNSNCSMTEDEMREKYKDMYILTTCMLRRIEGLKYADGTDCSGYASVFLSSSDPALTLPNKFLFDIHERFANALYFFSIEDEITNGWPKPEIDPIPRFLRQAFYYFSRLVPLWARIKLYAYLWRVGNRRWPTISRGCVQRLPFGLIMKECIKAPQSEPNALKPIEQHTTISAPQLIDAGEHDGKTYIIMTKIPGEDLDLVLHLMSYEERDRLTDDLVDCVDQLRRIPNSTPYCFANTIGGSIYDHRIPDDEPVGPFNDETDFNNYLLSYIDCTPDKALRENGEPISMRQDHQSYFTHCGFHPSNILMQNGRLSGIVDWECAGYMPDYWECIKARRASWNSPPLLALFVNVFKRFGDYEEEWENKRVLWRHTHG